MLPIETWTRSNCFCFVESKHLCCNILDAKSFLVTNDAMWSNSTQPASTTEDQHVNIWKSAAVFAIVTHQFYASFSYCTFLKLCVNTNILLCWLYFEGDQTTDMPTVIQRTRFGHNIQTWSFVCVMICSSRWSYGVLRSTRWNGWISSKSHKMVRKELQSFCWCCKSKTK